MNQLADDELEVFVVIHDQGRLLQCEQDERFFGIPRRRYVFVGPRPIDKLAGREDVVIARDLPDNIEQYPNLLSFTGWYAVARNHLATTRYVSLLEYDVTLRADFVAKTLALLRERAGIVGYVPFQLSHPMYLHATPWLIPALAEIYGLDVVQLVSEYLDRGGADLWTATSNASLSASDLKAVVDWILPLTRVYRHDPIGAHVHERTLKVFCLRHGIESHYVPDLLKHAQERSHQIYALSRQEALRRATEMRPEGKDVT